MQDLCIFLVFNVYFCFWMIQKLTLPCSGLLAVSPWCFQMLPECPPLAALCHRARSCVLARLRRFREERLILGSRRAPLSPCNSQLSCNQRVCRPVTMFGWNCCSWRRSGVGVRCWQFCRNLLIHHKQIPSFFFFNNTTNNRKKS